MADLFTEESKEDLSLFEPDRVDESVIRADSSESNLIAQASIIDGADLVGTYRAISALEPEERKAALGEVGRKAKEEQNSQNLNILSSTMLDPNLSEEDKENLILSYQGETNKPYSSLVGTAEKLHVSTSGKESEAEERRMADVGSLITPIMEEVALSQQATTALAYDEEGDAVSLTNNFGDLTELLIMMNEQNYARQIRAAVDKGEVSTVEELINFALLGEGKVDIRQAYERFTPEERKDFLEKSFSIMNNAYTFNFLNDNDLIELDNFLAIQDPDYYTTGDRILDDIGSALDLIPVVNLFSRAAKGLYQSAKLSNTMQKISRKRTASKKQPASVVSLAEQVNPEVARAISKDVVEDTTGEAAEVLAGTTRTEAVVEMSSPQVKSPDGSVTAKPYAIDKEILDAAYHESSRIERTPAEKASALEKTSEDLGKVEKLARYDEGATSHTLKDNGSIDIVETYIAKGGAFTSAGEAVSSALRHLQHYGVREEDITVMRKSGTDFVETTVKEAEALNELRTAAVKSKKALPEELKKVNMQDEYAVKVEFNYQPKALDITRDDLDVKLNFLDRLSSKAPVPGSTTASRYIFQVAHMLHPTITQASVAAVDRGNRLQKVIMDKFTKGVLDPMGQLSDASATRLSKVMHDQNMARKNFTREELEQLGIVEDAEIAILDNWKYMNDQLWHLTNMDMAKTLREKNYSMYKDVEADTLLIGKVMHKNTPLSNRPSTIYDPVAGETKLTSNSWSKWDEEGAQVFELKQPQMIDDVEVKHILVRQGDGKRYTKAVQDNDTILPYIEGWSHIDYKDPYFIDRVMVDKNGREIPSTKQSILTSPESKSAAIAIDRLTENASNALKGRTWKYTARNSREMDATEIALKKFEVASTAGLTSQRKRGQTIKQFDSSRTGDMAPNIADPLDSFKNSAAELSRRVPMREFLDDFEARILQKHGDVLPKDEFNNPKIPNAGEKFVGGDRLGSEANKKMADAKAMIEHYNYLKFGYYNNIDAGWKNAVNFTSKIAGLASRRMEKAIRALGEEVPSLIGFFKGTAFNAHIALSAPPSQWMVQGLPALMNGLLHPQYVMDFKNGLLPDMRKLVIGITKEGDDAALIKQVGKEKAAEIIQLRKEWDKTGLAVGVDKHLLVENGLEHMMPTGSKFEKVKKPFSALVDKGREWGFDKGETFQLMAYWLAARNDAIKSNKSMSDADVFDSVRSKTRTLTMNMNKAGEMPWNKDSLSLWTQFMISP